jgi:hypothetical protein
MSGILFWIGVLVVLTMLGKYSRMIIAGIWGNDIAAKALAQQPDRIHLTKTETDRRKNAATALGIVDALKGRGFKDAGIHEIPEMPGVTVQLLAQYDEGFYAAIYDHPAAGCWFDIVTRYQDGTASTFTTARATGLKPRPGFPNVNAPGTSAPDLLARARRERPRSPFKSASVETAARDFEDSYADSMSWRKNQGISTGEVVDVARRAA